MSVWPKHRRPNRSWPLSRDGRCSGVWAGFKICDMIDRVWGAPILFPNNICLLYDEPLAGLELAAQREGIHPATLLERLLDYFERFPAPPTGDRPCGPSELETACCKWHSYVGGHYYLGRDIQEQRAALVDWGATAQQILAAYPQSVCF